MLLKMLAVGIGGFVGANARYLMSAALTSAAFPLGTFTVNMLGCFGLALFATLVDTRFALSEPLRLMLATGFFGALTTFSTFSFETWHLIDRGDSLTGIGYLFASVLLGLAMCIVGIWVGRTL